MSQCSQKNVQIISRRKVTANNLKIFQTALKEKDFVASTDDPGHLYCEFFRWYLAALDGSIPVRQSTRKQVKTFNDWATPGIKISKQRMLHLNEIQKNTKDTIILEYIKTYKKTYKKVIWSAKQKYLKYSIDNSDNKIKAAWNIIKKECTKNPTCNNCVRLNVNGSSIDDATTVAELFNDYFSSIPVNISCENTGNHSALSLLEGYCIKNPNSLLFSPTNSFEIIKVAKSLKMKNSTDLWNISTKILKSSVTEISHNLSFIFNRCMEHGFFPTEMKMAKVVPIFKKGCPENRDNYRPISLLPVFSKIFEKLILTRLVNFFAENQILSKKQFGFQKNLSTQDAIASLIKKTLLGLDNKEKTVGIFCDLSKAFDCVDHSILLKKIEYYGIRNKELQLIESYLQERTQITQVENSKSAPQNIHKGVPQGSILGPFLFLVYINDIPECLKSVNDEIILFADDTSLLFSDKNKDALAQRIKETIDRLSIWFHVNNLSLNVNKSKAICFSLRPSVSHEMDVYFGSDKLENVSSTKFLGLEIDQKLQWSDHLNDLSKKLCSAIFAIRKIRNLCGLEAAKSVYFAYFHSLITYGLLFWGMAPNSTRIFLLQKRAVRSLYRISPRSSCKPLFVESGIMTLFSSYIYQNIMYARRHIEEVPVNSDFHHHDTRKKSNLHINRQRLSKVRYSFIHQNLCYYNKIPEQIKSLGEDQFKKIIINNLVRNPIYDIREFDNFEFIFHAD